MGRVLAARGHVHDGLGPRLAQRCIQPHAIEEVAFEQPCAVGHGVAVALAEIVVHAHGMAAGQQHLGHDAADVAGAAGHEHAHAGDYPTRSLHSRAREGGGTTVALDSGHG